MHGIVPEGLDISVAAMSILGLSRVTLRRKGICLEDILEGDPPIGHDVISAISWNRLDEYCRFVEAFLAEERPGQYFHQCENCGVSAVVNNRCEACFESMDFFTWASCDEEFVLPESFRSNPRRNRMSILRRKDFSLTNRLRRIFDLLATLAGLALSAKRLADLG